MNKQIEQEFEVANDTIRNMNLIVETAFGQQKSILSGKLKGYKQQIEKLLQDWQRYNSADKTRSKILQGNRLMDSTTDRINDTHRIALDTEDIGTSTLGKLKSDREKLEALDTELDVIDTNVDRARTIIGAMGRRVVTNKLILFLIIILLIAANLATIYFRWIAPHLPASTPRPTPTPTPTPTPALTPTP